MFHRKTLPLVVLVFGGLAATCGDTPTGPSQGIWKLEIAGPGSLAPGSTAQFRLVATMADGSTRDLTAEADWRSAEERVLALSRSGSAAARDVGEALISAAYEQRWVNRTIFVLPPGTYHVAGAVHEANSGGTLLSGARVQIRSGSAVLFESTTGPDGRFRFYGVPSGAELRVTRDGYEPHTRTLQLTDNAATLAVELALVVPRPNVWGTYTLTVGSQACSGSSFAPPLPDELRQRTYTAVLTQEGARVTVTLGGASFVGGGGHMANRFEGIVDATGVTFRLTEGSYYYYSRLPDVTELLADRSMLVVHGTATTAITPQGLEGGLKGHLMRITSLFTTSATGICQSDALPFILRR